MRSQLIVGTILASMLVGQISVAEDNAAPPHSIEVDADEPLAAVIEGRPAELQFVSGFVDRLTLNVDYVAKHGIRPAAIMGNADVNFFGRREIKGKNRPVGYSIGSSKENARAFWFAEVPQPKYDGAIGPFAMPFDVVTVRMAPLQAGEKIHNMIYFGDANNGSNAGHIDPTFHTAVSFAVEKRMRYPLASAATGAAIAAAYGGTLSGETWDEAIAFGVKRPVRLLTLEKPFVIGQFSFTKIAVRVRGSIDAGGAGEAIAEAPSASDRDPAEIVVIGAGKKPRIPVFSFDIDRNVLDACSTISFDKPAKQIRLSCRPT